MAFKNVTTVDGAHYKSACLFADEDLLVCSKEREVEELYEACKAPKDRYKFVRYLLDVKYEKNDVSKSPSTNKTPKAKEEKEPKVRLEDRDIAVLLKDKVE